MSFDELISKRQSVRRYSGRPVEKEKLEKLVEAVRLAPSASNSQPWKLILVDDPVLKDKVAHATFSRVIAFNRFAAEASVIAVMVIEKPRWITQVGIAMKKSLTTSCNNRKMEYMHLGANRICIINCRIWRLSLPFH